MVKLLWDNPRTIDELKSEIKTAYGCMTKLRYEIKNMETLMKQFESLPLVPNRKKRN